MASNIPLILLIACLVTASNFGKAVSKAKDPTPVVMWHGMGGYCCGFGMQQLEDLIKEETGGAYVMSLKIGDSVINQMSSGYFMPCNEQVELACNQIKADPQLANGYHAIGLSQGGQFLRAVAQRCPDPPMKNLVSMGGQHQGVYGIPRCPGDTKPFCDDLRKLASNLIYEDHIQSHLAQAQYWQDPHNHEKYVEKSQFLAEINNEPPYYNASYAENLAKLEHLILVMFSEDAMVQPKESSHFGFYKIDGDNEVLDMEDTDTYVEDRLGLAAMNEAGKVVKMETEGDHLQFTNEWLTENIIHPYFT